MSHWTSSRVPTYPPPPLRPFSKTPSAVGRTKHWHCSAAQDRLIRATGRQELEMSEAGVQQGEGSSALGSVRIILGSASSSRRCLMDELAAQHGFSYEVCTADIDEKAIREVDPVQLVTRLAHAKADAIREKLAAAGMHTGLLLTCDQVVVHEGRILEKPHNAEEARQFIDGYGRAPAQTVGSVVCTDLDSGRTFEGVDIATIHFRPLPAEAVEALIEEGSVFWCAGGLMVEHELVQPHVAQMEGTLDAVMGLPQALVLRLLWEALAAAVHAGSAAGGNGGVS